MDTYSFTTSISQEDFDAFASSHELSHLMQSWNWAKVKSNWKSLHTAVYKNGTLAGTALVLIRSLPGGFSMFYIPRGPLLDYHDQELLNFYIQSLKKEARRHHALFIKMDPGIEIGHYDSSNPERPHNGNEAMVSILEKAGAIHQGFTREISQTIQPRYHSILDKPDDLLAAMPKKTRKMVKEAEKRHLEICSGQQELLDDFAALVEKTESRKHVALRNKEYFAQLLSAFPQDSVIMVAYADLGRIMADNQKRLEDIEKQIAGLCENQKKKLFTLEEQKASVLKDIKNIQEIADAAGTMERTPVAGVLTVQFGKNAEMLYAGMDERFRRFMPQYKTYIENFQWAFDHGCEHFSMGGVEGSLDDGLTRFKDHFAPEIHEYIGEFDIPVNHLLYRASKIAYNLRRQNLKHSEESAENGQKS